MILVANVGRDCLVIGSHMVETQPALTGVELDILRAVDGQSLTISALASQLGCSYGYTWGMVYRLKRRGLVDLERATGNGLVIRALAMLAGDPK